MAAERRASGFKPVGSCPPERLGLPDRRATELRLASAWAECAGPVLAERTQPVGVRRGVLEIRLSEPDWTVTVSELLPGLAARLARMEPRLDIRSCRLTIAGARGEADTSRRFDLRRDDALPVPSKRARAAPRESTEERAPSEDAAEWLRGLAEHYLDRAAGRQSQKP